MLPKFKHALVVVGGGCSGAAGADKKGKKPGAAKTHANTQGQQQLLDLEELVSRAPDWEHKMPQVGTGTFVVVALPGAVRHIVQVGVCGPVP